MNLRAFVSCTLLVTLLLLLLSTVVQANEYRETNSVVKAEDILKHIEDGDNIYLENCQIVGELNLSNAKLEEVPNLRYQELSGHSKLDNLPSIGDEEDALKMEGRWLSKEQENSLSAEEKSEYINKQIKEYYDEMESKLDLIDPKVNRKLKVVESRITIINCNLENNLDFSDSLFKEPLSLIRVNCPSNINFIGSYFNNSTDFSETTFNNNVYYSYATFNGNVDFERVTFNNPVDLFFATFNGTVDFQYTTFNDTACFTKSAFINHNPEPVYIQADNPIFKSTISFWYATFNDDADFDLASFDGPVDFEYMVVTGYTNFEDATFNNYTNFWGSTFSGIANFERATFIRDTDFTAVTFNSSANFYGATFNSLVKFGSDFNDFVDFSDAKFNSFANFQSTKFNNSVTFYSSNFNNVAYFSYANFKNSVDFSSSYFNHTANFWLADFRDTVEFEGPETPENIISDGINSQVFIQYYKGQGRYGDANIIYYNSRKETQARKGWFEFSKWIDIISWLTCGYGVKPSYTFSTSGIIIILFASIYSQGSGISKLNERSVNGSQKVSIKDALLFSITTFANLDKFGWSPKENFGILAILEGLIGIIILGISTTTILIVMTIG